MNNSADKPTLEEVLDGITWAQKMKQEFQATVNNHLIITKTPLYIAPATIIDNEFHLGGYSPEEGLTYTPIGLEHNQNEEIIHYSCDSKNKIFVKNKKKDNLIYLPLELTAIQADITINGKDAEGSPFHLYTVEGLPYNFPFIIYQENKTPLGFYQGNNNKLKNVQINNIPPLLQHMASLINKTYSFTDFPEGADKPKFTLKKIEEEPICEVETTGPVITKRKLNESVNWNEPPSIKKVLDKYIVGQHHAKKIASNTISIYMKEVETRNMVFPRSNVILIGPTGVGKSLIWETIAQLAELPIGQVKLGACSGPGFVGQDALNALRQIREQTEEPAPYGIAILDELDKIVDDGHHGWGGALHNEIISWTDGTMILLDHRNDIWIDTTNILFVGAGACSAGSGNDKETKSALEKIIAKRLNVGQRTVGFHPNPDEYYEEQKIDKSSLLVKLIPEDLISFGMKPEVVRRFPITGVLNQLTTEDKFKILTTAKNNIFEKYQNFFKSNGYNLIADKTTFKLIAESCPPNTGASGLNAVCSRLLTEIIFNPKEFASSKGVIRLNEKLAQELIDGTYKIKEKPKLRKLLTSPLFNKRILPKKD